MACDQETSTGDHDDFPFDGGSPFTPFYLRRRECGSRVPATADGFRAAKLADRKKSSIPRRVAKCWTSGSLLRVFSV